MPRAKRPPDAPHAALENARPAARSLAGKRFVVTGASSGIGAAIASGLAAAGATLVIIGRNRERLKRVAASVRPGLGTTQTIVADFERPKSVAAALRQVRRIEAPLHGLVHCAGAYNGARVTSSDAAELARLMRVNVESPIFLTLGLRDLLAPESDVVFVNSSVIQRVAVEAACYAASKHALRSLADSLRQEVNAAGTRVVSLFPGRTATPMQEGIMRAEGKPYEGAELIRPEDIGELVVGIVTLPRTIEVTEVFMRPARAPARRR